VRHQVQFSFFNVWHNYHLLPQLFSDLVVYKGRSIYHLMSLTLELVWLFYHNGNKLPTPSSTTTITITNCRRCALCSDSNQTFKPRMSRYLLSLMTYVSRLDDVVKSRYHMPVCPLHQDANWKSLTDSSFGNAVKCKIYPRYKGRSYTDLFLFWAGHIWL